MTAAFAAQGTLTAVLSSPPKAIERLARFYHAFTRKQIMKNFDIVADVSRRDHCPMPLVAHVRQQFETAFANGCSDLDFVALVREAARHAGFLQ